MVQFSSLVADALAGACADVRLGFLTGFGVDRVDVVYDLKDIRAPIR
jgi:hypothetical protein